MTRFLVLFAAALLIAYLVAEGVYRLRGKLSELLNAKPPYDRVRERQVSQRHGGELIPCAACGLHVARSRAIEDPAGRRIADRELAGGRLFCSEACRRRAAAAS